VTNTIPIWAALNATAVKLLAPAWSIWIKPERIQLASFTVFGGAGFGVAREFFGLSTGGEPSAISVVTSA
jgi:hypothetical protein